MNYGFMIVFVLLIYLMLILLYNCAYIIHKSKKFKIRPAGSILQQNPMSIQIINE